MINAEELDGQSDLSQLIGQKVDHAVGIGKLVRVGKHPRGFPNFEATPETPILDTYAILIDLHCDRCLKTYPFFLFDGPSRGDWAYARENQYGPTLDMRNQNLYCDDECTEFSKEETKALIHVHVRGIVEAGKRESKYVSPAPVLESLAKRGLVSKHSTTARGYDAYRLTAKGGSLAVWIQSR